MSQASHFLSGLVGVSVSSTPPGLLSLQKSWDAPVAAAAHDALLGSAQDSYTKARLRAVAAPHAGDWLKVIPSSSLGLRLDDEAMRVSVGLCIGTNLCTPYTRVCGNPVDARGARSLPCIKSAVVRRYILSSTMSSCRHVRELVCQLRESHRV